MIDAADKALADKDKALQLKDLALQDCAGKNANLQSTVDVDTKKLSSIFENPYAMILLGLIVGGAGTAFIEGRARK